MLFSTATFAKYALPKQPVQVFLTSISKFQTKSGKQNIFEYQNYLYRRLTTTFAGIVGWRDVILTRYGSDGQMIDFYSPGLHSLLQYLAPEPMNTTMPLYCRIKCSGRVLVLPPWLSIFRLPSPQKLDCF